MTTTRESLWRGAGKVLDVAWGLVARPAAENVARFYSVCPDEAATFLGGRILNFGWWETGREDHQTAGRALVRQVAELAELAGGQTVLDAGCGFGAPALLFHREYGVNVVGLNVTPAQLAYAEQSAHEQGAADRVTFVPGDATRMPLPDAAFDRVIALESAFHFAPREAFFREAYRVLRPGAGRLLKALAAAAWLFPAANDYDVAGYVERLARSGFRNVEARSIREKVYPPYVRWTLAPENRTRLRRLLGWPRAQAYVWQTELLGALDRRGLLDYILVRAVKEGKP